MELPLSKPDITNAEIEAVHEVLKTSYLSLGKKYIEFQNAMARFVGVTHAIAVNSGTSGLHLIVKSLGITKGDEVITTSFSFVASANCILYEGATPVFVDIDKDTLNIDVSKIEKAITKNTKAILAVDVFSHPADWGALQKIAKKHNLFLIEDAAEALGSTYKGKPCGSFADAAVFAFYPNKQITTGEGGMVVTSNEEIAEFCRSAANQGRASKEGKWLEHIRLGYNYRMDEMSAAMGIAQMGRIEEILEKRKNVAALYDSALQGMELETPYIASDSQLSWFVYVVRLSEKYIGKRDAIIQEMKKRGIHCSNYFLPIHLQPFYRSQFGYKEGDFPVCENIAKKTLALPFFNDLKKEEIEYVVKNLKEALAHA